jgi:hypothetical protein
MSAVTWARTSASSLAAEPAQLQPVMGAVAPRRLAPQTYLRLQPPDILDPQAEQRISPVSR